MAIANQIKALLKSHVDGDDALFLSIAMQMAAQEAKKGHGNLAKEIRDLIDSAKSRPKFAESKAIPLAKPKGELSQLLNVSYPQIRLVDMVLSECIQAKLDRLIKEHKQVQKLRAHGLSPRKKLLLVGPPGTGKTMTASVLAGELGLPLFIVRLESLMTKYMGETAGKLRLIFDAIDQTRGVYLFDEFDSIGSQRGNTNDVGEIRRILNSFLQMIEQDTSDSLLIAATNHHELLDHALFRRFDDLIEFDLPGNNEIITALKSKLTVFKTSRILWKKVAEAALTLSYGDITRACEDAIKYAIIHNKDVVSQSDLINAVKERRLVRQKAAS